MKTSTFTKPKLNCTNCFKDLTNASYNPIIRRATAFTKWTGCTPIESICLECWDNGVRYSKK